MISRYTSCVCKLSVLLFYLSSFSRNLFRSISSFWPLLLEPQSCFLLLSQWTVFHRFLVLITQVSCLPTKSIIQRIITRLSFMGSFHHSSSKVLLTMQGTVIVWLSAMDVRKIILISSSPIPPVIEMVLAPLCSNCIYSYMYDRSKINLYCFIF